jgi:hypothetical protein
MTEDRSSSGAGEGERRDRPRFLQRFADRFSPDGVMGGMLDRWRTPEPSAWEGPIEDDRFRMIPAPHERTAPLTVDEIHAMSLAAANELVERNTEHTRTRTIPFYRDEEFFAIAHSIRTLSAVRARTEGARAYREGADQVDALGGDMNFMIASEMRFRAVILGDKDASDMLKAKLQEEKDGPPPKTIQESLEENLAEGFSGAELGQSPRRGKVITTESYLKTVVEMCAQEGVPADTWISTYRRDEKHEAQLKLTYFSEEQRTGGDGYKFGPAYLDQIVTDHFPRMEDADVVAASEQLWRLQKDPEERQAIFQRVQERCDKPVVDYPTYAAFIHLAEAMLADYDSVSFDQAMYIERWAEQQRAAFIMDGADPATVNNATSQVRVQLVDYFGGTPDEVLAKIKSTAQEVYDLPQKEDEVGQFESSLEKGRAASQRDRQLSHFAQQYMHRGDFDIAKRFLNAVNSDLARKDGVRDCLALAETAEQIAAITPEAAKDSAEISDLIETRLALTSGDPQRIRELAMAKSSDRMSFADEQVIDACIEKLSEIDEEAGQTLTAELIASATERMDPHHAYDLARQNFERGDTAALEVMLDQAENFQGRGKQLEAYAEIARLTAPEHPDARTATEPTMSQEETLYINEQGQFITVPAGQTRDEETSGAFVLDMGSDDLWEQEAQDDIDMSFPDVHIVDGNQTHELFGRDDNRSDERDQYNDRDDR